MFKITFMDVVRAVLIIFATGIVGGGIAFLGNQLGRYIGRKKLSVFKLRPRYTSMLITVVTGMVIASLTIAISLIVSEPTRIMFLHAKQFSDQVKQYEKTIEQYRKIQQTDLVYKKDDIIVSAVMKTDPDPEKMKMALKEVVAQANHAAMAKSQQVSQEKGAMFSLPPDGRLVGYIPENLDKIAVNLSKQGGEQVIFARAYQHAALGNKFQVELGGPIPNGLVYKKGQLVYTASVDGSKGYLTVYDQLLKGIKEDVSFDALNRGLFPNPEDRSVGEFDENKLKALANKIAKEGRPAQIEFYSQDDTYILGPLRLVFQQK